MIGKKKLALILILWLIVCLGVYIAAVKIGFWYITPIYMAVSFILMIIYVPLFLKSVKIKALSAREGGKLSGKEQKQIEKLTVRMKYLLLLFTPIIIVLLCDYLYITLLSQSGFLKALTDYYI